MKILKEFFKVLRELWSTKWGKAAIIICLLIGLGIGAPHKQKQATTASEPQQEQTTTTQPSQQEQQAPPATENQKTNTESAKEQEQVNYLYNFRRDLPRLTSTDCTIDASTLEMNHIGDSYVIFHCTAIIDGEPAQIEVLYYSSNGKLIQMKKGHEVIYQEEHK